MSDREGETVGLQNGVQRCRYPDCGRKERDLICWCRGRVEMPLFSIIKKGLVSIPRQLHRSDCHYCAAEGPVTFCVLPLSATTIALANTIVHYFHWFYLPIGLRKSISIAIDEHVNIGKVRWPAPTLGEFFKKIHKNRISMKNVCCVRCRAHELLIFYQKLD